MLSSSNNTKNFLFFPILSSVRLHLTVLDGEAGFKRKTNKLFSAWNAQILICVCGWIWRKVEESENIRKRGLSRADREIPISFPFSCFTGCRRLFNQRDLLTLGKRFYFSFFHIKNYTFELMNMYCVTGSRAADKEALASNESSLCRDKTFSEKPWASQRNS